MLPEGKKTVLVSPLNWGLGHATRVIPLIRILKASGVKVIVGAYGRSALLLKKECPDCVHVELNGFTPAYSRKFSQSFALMMQGFRFLFLKHKEYELTKRIVREHDVDMIISDNRYGVRHDHVFSVIITHQLSPLLNGGLSLFKGAAARFFKKWIDRFDECWVPDVTGVSGISGLLSVNRYGIKNVKHIGVLSRFNKCSTPVDHGYEFLAVISGPEPWRSLFEKDLTSLFTKFKAKSAIVRGVPDKDEEEYTNDGITYFNHLDAGELNTLMCRSDNIICRSGYSTLMDLFKIGRRALLVPTPGQPEQEYLAVHMSAGFGFLSVDQKNIAGVESSVFSRYEQYFTPVKESLPEFLFDKFRN